MTSVPRSETYYITDTDETIGRLIRDSESRAQDVRDGFHRTDVGPGDTVIEIGCGPIGALLELSDLVGPRGTVVGLDMDPASLRRARVILDRAGRENVRLVHANINADAPRECVEVGPYDAAYCRSVLSHQPDPAATLRRIAALLQPGGYLVAHEPLIDGPQPRSEPPVSEFEQLLRWIRDVGRRHGGSPDVSRHFHAIARQAGFREVSQRAFGRVESHDARRTIQGEREALVAIRPALVRHAVATASEIGVVLDRLAEAERWAFEAHVALLYVELVAQVPAAVQGDGTP
jgi:SAM-dependent methyltransferase